MEHPFAAVLSLILAAVVGHSLAQIYGAAIAHWHNPTLFNDSLEFVEVGQGSGLLDWIVKQHNEHRIIWTKLGALLESRLLDIVPGQTALFQNLVLLLCSGALWTWLCIRLLRHRANCLLTSLAGWVVLLNPWQWENIYWEFQPPWFLINCLVLAAALLMSFTPAKRSKQEQTLLVLAAALPWVAIPSTGQGVAFALSFCICAFLYSRKLGLTVAGSTLLAGFGFFVLLPYIKISRTEFRIEYFLNMILGGAWRGIPVLCLVAIAILLIKRYQLTRTTLPSALMPALFAATFAAMVTLSRSGLGMDQAEASRYVTHLLMLGLSALLFLGLSNEKPGPLAGFFQGVGPLTVLLITIGSLPHSLLKKGATYSSAWEIGQFWQRDRELSTICHAANASHPWSSLQDLHICRQLIPGSPYPDVIYEYFNNQLPVKPTGWHQQLLSQRLTGLASRPSETAIRFQLDRKQISSDVISVKGWAYAVNDPDGVVFLIARYGGGSTLVADAFDKRRNFEQEIPRRFNGESLLAVELVGQSNRTVIASFPTQQ